MEQEQGLVIRVNQELKQQLSDPAVVRALLATTFKGLTETSMRQALLEGMIRGFKFKDFLKKDVYAIPYGEKYSLVTSIDHARKIGMKSGVVGVTKPIYTEIQGKVATCEITVKKIIDGHVGEFTAEVYFNEYYKAGKPNWPSFWDTKPRTMIAKVAEMHALRKACPEELAKTYAEEEFDKERAYDNSEIADDAVVVSTGDDTQGMKGADEEKVIQVAEPSESEMEEIEKKTNEDLK